MPSVYEIITEKIIKQLESGVAPWRKPWTCQTPANLITQKEYRGLNVFTLASQGFPSRFWLTFNQVSKLGGRIWKGEKSSPVIFWNVGEEQETVKSDGTKDTSRSFLISFCPGRYLFQWTSGFPSRLAYQVRTILASSVIVLHSCSGWGERVRLYASHCQIIPIASLFSTLVRIFRNDSIAS